MKYVKKKIAIRNIAMRRDSVLNNGGDQCLASRIGWSIELPENYQA
jgi:hypothetical protein